ncbi:hypothetical protein YA28_01650 [Klebsiella aerogenes]|nr:hypothetical protein YA28_01650 [Klebsiella aerogenes]KUQ19157.1 hypothetical protein AWI09_10870 [Klebsiella aerogenes]KUR08839.1 hypothetical protein AWI35_20980 [Klebsiella aerogenes]
MMGEFHWVEVKRDVSFILSIHSLLENLTQICYLNFEGKYFFMNIFSRDLLSVYQKNILRN